MIHEFISLSFSPRRWLTTTHGQSVLVMLAIAIGFSVLPIVSVFTKPLNNKDFSRWWEAASAVRDGAALYPPDVTEFGGFIYPPGIAVVFYTPLSLLGPLAMVAALCSLTFAGHAVGILASVQLAAGNWRNQHPLVYAVPLLVTLPFVWDIYFLGQFNLTMLGLMLLGLLALGAHRPGLCGGLLAFAASVKAFPITVLGYLVWRRQWAACIAMLVSLVLLMLIVPSFVRGFDRHFQESWTWFDRMILSTSQSNLANQPERAFRSGNQSLMSVVHRLSRPTEPPDVAPDPNNSNVNLIDIGPRGSFLLFGAIAAAICAAYVLAMPRKAARTSRTDALEYAILLLLIVMFSPKAGTYYFCWNIPALAIITAELLRSPIGSRRRGWLTAGLLAAVLILSTALSQVFRIPAPQSYGATLWGSVVLLLMLLALLYKAARTPRSELLDQPRSASASDRLESSRGSADRRQFGTLGSQVPPPASIPSGPIHPTLPQPAIIV